MLAVVCSGKILVAVVANSTATVYQFLQFYPVHIFVLLCNTLGFIHV